MSRKKDKIIVVVGPTASGKSELAVCLAKRFNGEIISADSRQIYRGFDIGTGKVKGRWHTQKFIYKGIPHYCIDFVSPKEQFSVVDFVNVATRAIILIRHHGKIPIIVGGTGFWIDALVYDIKLPHVSPDMSLRKILVKKTTQELLRMLTSIDPARAKTIDAKNPRRLIRAIEIAKTLGRVPTAKKHPCYNALWIGVKTEPEILKIKIKTRLEKRIREGMIREAAKLHRKGLSWKHFYVLGLEYRFLADFLQKKITRIELSQKLFTAIWHYAKRQITWFKRNQDIHWIKNKNEASVLVKKFFKS